MLQEFPDVQAGFRKGRGIRDQTVNILWIIEKARKFQKNIYLCFIDYTKAFDYVDHNKLWKALKKIGMPDRLICLLRHLYMSQEATVRTLYRKMDGEKEGWKEEKERKEKKRKKEKGEEGRYRGREEGKGNERKKERRKERERKEGREGRMKEGRKE